jgi:Protein of unknown function (DUF2793)/Chaperone of endosialidase
VDQSSRLGLSFLAPAQAQKHVTVNESLLRLDALVQLSVTSATVSDEPTSPVDGSVYILPAGKTGAAWGPMANGALAYWHDGAWEALAPKEGWIAWVGDTNTLMVHDGTAWSQNAVRAGLALGTAALANTGTSGATVPLLNAANTWAAAQTMAGGLSWGAQINRASATQGGGFFLQAPTTGMTLSGELVCDVAFDSMRFYASGGANKGAYLYLGAALGGAGTMMFNGSHSPLPDADAGIDLGSASKRFGTVFAATGAINTSDAREKTALAALSPAERAAGLRLIGSVGAYQWLASIAAKGQDGARQHVGLTAQAVRAAFEAVGLDAGRYGLFCRDVVTERDAQGVEQPVLDELGAPVTRLGVRTDQALWLAIAALAALVLPA